MTGGSVYATTSSTVGLWRCFPFNSSTPMECNNTTSSTTTTTTASNTRQAKNRKAAYKPNVEESESGGIHSRKKQANKPEGQGQEEVRNQSLSTRTSDSQSYPARIINTHTLEFETNYTLFRHRYATFSHTWTQENTEVDFVEAGTLLAKAKGWSSEDEVEGCNFTELQDSGGTAPLELHEGPTAPPTTTRPENISPAAAKLLRVIKEAKDLGYIYLWVDNCCINKDDNEELTEALSSMGEWYANASICLVYLEDFTLTPAEFLQRATGTGTGTGTALGAAADQCPRWATRGWTLQEIVMSQRALFYNRHWAKIFDTQDDLREGPGVTDYTLRSSALARLCRVPPALICSGQKPDIPAAALMSMAATRTTKQVEDRVYSLLGMLGVRLKVAYGEGLTSAVERLVDQLLRAGVADASIFNWVGAARGNPVVGRSMYPVDFEGFSAFGGPAGTAGAIDEADLRRDKFRVPGGIGLVEVFGKPGGIRSCFDVCRIPAAGISFASTTSSHHPHPRCPLPRPRPAHAGLPVPMPMNSPAAINGRLQGPGPMVARRCSLLVGPGLLLEVEMCCPAGILRDTITNNGGAGGGEDGESRSAISRCQWLLAKFSGAPGADWFLCATTSTNTPAQADHGHAQAATSGPEVTVTVTAVRIATGEFTQIRRTDSDAGGDRERRLTSAMLDRLLDEGGLGLGRETVVMVVQ